MMHKSQHLLRNNTREPMKSSNCYISEFESFINQFLGDHPEVVEDQRRGMAIYWDRKVDFEALDKAHIDSVPDDRYGFSGPHPAKDVGSPDCTNNK